LARRGAEGIAALVRYSSSEAFAIIPPAMAQDGQWHEEGGESEKRSTNAGLHANDIFSNLAKVILR
jgi:hypothetical protein